MKEACCIPHGCVFHSLSAECPFHPSAFEPDVTVLHAGRLAEHMWFVRTGAVLMESVMDANGAAWSVVRGPGSFVGWDAIEGQPSACRAVTLLPSELCVVQSKHFRSWLGPASGPMGALFALARGEIAAAREDVQMVHGTATERVARFLLDRRNGRAVVGAPASLQLLARVLGMRPETLSRAVADLRRAGALAPRSLAIVDENRLRTFVGEA